MYYRKNAAVFTGKVVQGLATLQASASLYAPLPSVVADTLPPSVIGYGTPVVTMADGVTYTYAQVSISSWTVTPQAGDTIIAIATVEDYYAEFDPGASIGYPTGYTQIAELNTGAFGPYANGAGSVKVWKRTATGTSADNFSVGGFGESGSYMTASAIVIPNGYAVTNVGTPTFKAAQTSANAALGKLSIAASNYESLQVVAISAIGDGNVTNSTLTPPAGFTVETSNKSGNKR